MDDSVLAARDAALGGRSIVERTFKIELLGIDGWPNPEIVVAAPGAFLMGEEPIRREGRIGYPFALGRCPLTFAEWDVARASGARLRRPKDQGWGRDCRPVINVSWDDAQAYLSWLNTELGLIGHLDRFRLPSEAEWEYACRAGWATPFSTGASITKAQAQFDANKTAPVGSFAANAFGLYDMHGNVWEWCEDVWSDDCTVGPGDGTARIGEQILSERVLRGGCWNSVSEGVRSAARNGDLPSVRRPWFGFRVARTLPSD